MKSLIEKFSIAFKGLFSGIKDTSIRTQYAFFILAIVVAIIFKFTKIEWIIVLIISSIVIGMEYFNTAIERICDLVSLEENKRIKYIKDLSAGAVLFVSILALIIGLLLVSNHL